MVIKILKIMVNNKGIFRIREGILKYAGYRKREYVEFKDPGRDLYSKEQVIHEESQIKSPIELTPGTYIAKTPQR